jgi:hypothetical protein
VAIADVLRFSHFLDDVHFVPFGRGRFPRHE